MSEYWKSTPRYWCKHCKIFIRDTAFEKTQHEATGKHQSNLKRFLRDLHRNHEREEKESQRAKDEVNRLNSLVAGSSTGGDRSDPPWKRTSMASAAPSSRSATLEDRKKQIAQLAEMGVAVPEEFRREMAMAGEWETISERPIGPQEDEQADHASLNKGIRKRKLEGQEEEEEEAAQRAVKKNWGSTTRQYPGAQDDEDLDALLELTKDIKGKGLASASMKVESKSEEPDIPIKHESTPPPPTENEQPPAIKKEESFQGVPESIPAAGSEAQETVPGVVFKKRKPKFARK